LLLQTKKYAEILDAFECAFTIDSDVNIPPSVYFEWAKQLFEKPNLAFLEVDTTGLGDDDEIIRILLLDCNGKPLFNTFICGDKDIPEKISMITGVTNKHLDSAPALIDAWEDISQAFKGKYIISFNLEFDVEMLETAAERYELERFGISGECLMRRAMLYSRSHSYSKLADLCAYIGQPLPDYPYRTAFHRAKGQIAILRAIFQNKRLEDAYEDPPYQDPYFAEDLGYL
jgi:DNA polymerase III alpha subunit (gram-positive type)